jgi:uncharacterized membrane protein YhhN
MTQAPLFFAILYAANAATQLFAIVSGGKKLRMATKILILPILALYYFFACNAPLWLVFAACAGSWLGDILLLPQSGAVQAMPAQTRIKRARLNEVFLKLGLISFLLSHIFYMLGYAKYIPSVSSLPMLPLIATGLVMLGLVIILLRIVRPKKAFLLPMVVYAFVLASHVLMAMALVLSSIETVATANATATTTAEANGYVAHAALILGGSLFFMLSDSLLAYSTNHKISNRMMMAILLAYMIAQAGIIGGLSAF